MDLVHIWDTLILVPKKLIARVHFQNLKNDFWVYHLSVSIPAKLLSLWGIDKCSKVVYFM